MAPRPHDRFLVDYRIGANPKLATLPEKSRWVYVAGVLAIAAQSPIRGSLLLANGIPADEKVIARAASTSPAAARKALRSFRELGMLEPHDELEGVEHVHDFEVHNPPPPAHSTEGERLRKREQRMRQRLIEEAA